MLVVARPIRKRALLAVTRRGRRRTRDATDVEVGCEFSIDRRNSAHGVWRYRASDPLLVELALSYVYRRKNINVNWVFSRELVSESILGPVGDGDVHLESDGYSYRVYLATPSGSCELLCLVRVVEEFLGKTFDLVRQCYSSGSRTDVPATCEDPRCVECRVAEQEIDSLHRRGYL